jgi:hypothetical protein
MPTLRSFRRLVPVGTLVFCACGLFGGDAPTDGTSAGPADAVAPDSAASAASQEPSAPVATPQAAEPEIAVADADAPAGADTPSPPGAQAPGTGQALSIEERIDRLLESQEALNRRLDSLATALPAADSARGLADSGEVLG